MSTMRSLYESIREMILGAVDEELNAGDTAILRSKLAEASEAELYALLDEFFDIELVVAAIYEQFGIAGDAWSRRTREKLVESLIFCGLDGAAETVQATLR